MNQLDALKQFTTNPSIIFKVQFRYALNEDAMTSDKWAEGIRVFCADARKLESLFLA